MPSEGKVGSLFAQFRTNINQFVAEIQKMVSEVRLFDTTVKAASKSVSDLGHLGSASVNRLANDLGGLTSGLSDVNRFARQAVTGVSDFGHLGSAAINQVVNDLGRLTAGLGEVNRFARQTVTGVSDIGHLGVPAVGRVVNDLGGLTAGLSEVNRFARQTATGVADVGHLGSVGIRQTVNDLGGLTAGLTTANRFAQQAATGLSDLGHLGSVAATRLTDSFNTAFGQMSSELRKFDRNFYPIATRINQIGFALTAALTVPIVGIGAFAVKVGKEFETAFAGVRQVLDASSEELGVLRQQLIDLSTTTPTTAAEFANIATTAAKLGVETPNIANFAQTMAQLAAVTNLSGEAAANFLARFSNLTGLPKDQVDELGATLFALGKAFPAIESEIATFGLRVARVGTFVGLTSGQVLAFATAMASTGVQAEAGGTALSRVLANMATAVASGGVRLEQFAAVAKKSTNEFRDSFKTEGGAAGAVLAFVEGLKRIRAEGGNVFATLEAMQLSEVRVRDTLLALSLGSEQLTRALDVQDNQVQSTADFIKAYGERTKTTDSQITIFKNNVEALGISLFDAIGPVINNTILPALRRLIDEGLKPAIKAFQEMSPGMQRFVGGMALLAAAAGPALLIITKLTSFVAGLAIILQYLKLAEVGEKFAKLGISVDRFAGIVSKLATPLAVVGTVIAAWELENIIIDALNLGEQFDKVKSSAGELAGAILNLAGAFGKFAIGEIVNDLKGFKTIIDTLIGPVKEVAIALILPQLIRSGMEIKAATAYINGLSAAMDNAAKSTKPVSDISNSLTAAMARVAQQSNSLTAAMARVAAAGNITQRGSTGPSAEELAEQFKAAEELRKAHERLREKFTAELAPATELNRELDYLLQHFSADDVVAVYADKIVAATEAQRAHRIGVTGSTAALYDQAKAFERVGEMLKELAKTPVPTINLPVGEGLPGLSLPTSEITSEALKNFSEGKKQIDDLAVAIRRLDFFSPAEQATLFGNSLDKAAEFAKVFKISLDPSIQALIDQKKAMEDSADGVKAWEEMANAGMKAVDDMAVQMSAATEDVRRMEEAGFADAQILEILDKVIEQAAESARILGVQLDPVLDRLAKLRELMKANAKEMSDFEKEISRVTSKIINDLANGIADALLESKSIVEIAAKIAKDFAAAFIKAVIVELIAPLIEEFQKLGKRIAEALSSAIKDHPVLAAIAAVGLAAVAVVRALGNTHLFANQFVEETQNPFAKSLTGFIDTADKLYAAGRQTYEGAREAEAKVREMWQGFLDDAQKFGAEGRKQATVAAQAIATLEPVFRNVIFGIQSQIEALKPPSVRAVESVNVLAAYRAQIAANTEEHIAELQAQATAINDQIQEVQRQINIQDELGNSTAELNAQMRELVFQWNDIQNALNPVIPKLYTFAEAVKSVSENLIPDKTLDFLDQVLNATAGAANLEEALSILEEIGTPFGIIIDRLGDDVENFAKALEMSGLPIPALIEKYRQIKEASSKASGEMPRIANSLSKLVGDAVEKLRQIAGGGDLAQSILDALSRLLTGLPSPANPASKTENVVRDAVDKVRVVTEEILATLKSMMPAAADTRTNFQTVANIAEVPGFPGVSAVNSTVSQVMINVEDNEVINNEFTFTDEISRETVRDDVIPEITEALTNNTDSVKEKWVKILRGAGVGVSS